MVISPRWFFYGMTMQKLTIDTLEALKTNNGFWYLATPYTKYHAGIYTAYKMACVASAQLIHNGLVIFSPIVHSHPISKYGGIDPLDGKFWMSLDNKFLAITNGVIALEAPGWDTSIGVQEELKIVEGYKKPIYLLGWDDINFLININ